MIHRDFLWFGERETTSCRSNKHGHLDSDSLPCAARYLVLLHQFLDSIVKTTSIMTKIENDPSDEPKLGELTPLLELACWTAIALFPFLYWVNGPAVSTDQYVMRTILIAVAILGAFGLRIMNSRVKRRTELGDIASGFKSSKTIADDTSE